MSSKPKILYGLNGTGWGHLTRANALIPALRKHADVDILISGKMQDLDFDFDVKYHFKGFRFYYKKGSVDLVKTFLKFDFINAFKDIFKLNVKQYDFVISDFEPITAWSCLIKRHPIVQVGHQASFLSKKTPRPSNYSFLLKLHGEFTLQYFAYSRKYIGVHFERYDQHIVPPLLRDQIYNAKDIVSKKHISVYLPAYETTRLINFFKQFPNYNFEIFSLDCKEEKSFHNLNVFPLSDYFIKSILSSSGCISSAGFESNAEALYLEKPLLCVPIKYQYEQACNAAALKKLGVHIIPELTRDEVLFWLENPPLLPKLEVFTADKFAKAILNFQF